MQIEDLAKHKICFLGYGANHYRLVGFLLSKGISFTIRDRSPEKQAQFEQEFPQYTSLVTWEITPSILKGLTGFTVVFRSPSIPVTSPELIKAAAKGVLIYSQTKLFFDLCPAKIIGVTGTKGKGTTASLLQAFLSKGYKAGTTYLAGNIGLDPFDFYETLQKNDLVILELSSFQLQDLHVSPPIAIMLTVGTDHLDHHASIEEYQTAKDSLLRFQKKDDIAVINIHEPSMQRYVAKTPGLTYLYDRFTPRRQSAWANREGDKETIFVQVGEAIEHFDSSKRKLLGEHNLDNILPAVIVASLLKVPLSVMEEELRSFKGLPHRLTLVGTFKGVDFYDDSIATMPEATEAALLAFPGKRIHLLAGGNDKGGDYKKLGEVIAKQCITVSMLPGTATPKLKKAIQKAKGESPLLIEVNQDPLFPIALSGIHPHLKEGDVVLLSPAASSFASFANAKVRGELFAKSVTERYQKKEETV